MRKIQTLSICLFILGLICFTNATQAQNTPFGKPDSLYKPGTYNVWGYAFMDYYYKAHADTAINTLGFPKDTALSSPVVFTWASIITSASIFPLKSCWRMKTTSTTRTFLQAPWPSLTETCWRMANPAFT